MMRWTCEQLLRHPIFENFLFTVPHSDHEEYERARRAQVRAEELDSGTAARLPSKTKIGVGRS